MEQTLIGIVAEDLIKNMEDRDFVGAEQIDPCKAIQILQDVRDDSSIPIMYRKDYALSCFYDYLWFDDDGRQK